jgi:hypothetical protein
MVAESIHFFLNHLYRLNPSTVDFWILSVLSIQPLTEMSTRNICVALVV